MTALECEQTNNSVNKQTEQCSGLFNRIGKITKLTKLTKLFHQWLKLPPFTFPVGEKVERIGRLDIMEKVDGPADR